MLQLLVLRVVELAPKGAIVPLCGGANSEKIVLRIITDTCEEANLLKEYQ